MIRPQTKRQELLRMLMRRNAQRYMLLANRRLQDGRGIDYGLHDWFVDWHKRLQNEYVSAVNDDNSIIGKQYHVDHSLLGFTVKDLKAYPKQRKEEIIWAGADMSQRLPKH
jgi:hypothetical protein